MSAVSKRSPLSSDLLDFDPFGKFDPMAELGTKKSVKRINPRGDNTTLSIDDIRSVRFSQSSISRCMSDEQTLEEFGESVTRIGWKKQQPLTIVRMPDGQLTSLDNRRLYCLKNRMIDIDSVPVRIFDHSVLAGDKSIEGKKADLFKSGRITKEKYDGFRNEDDELNIRKLFKSLGITIPKANEIINETIEEETYGHAILLRMAVARDSAFPNPYGFDAPPVVR